VRWTFPTAGDDVVLQIDDAEEFESLRAVLGDPVWLVGASWEVLYTNDFKRSRFEDAFGAWIERRDGASVAAELRAAGVTATTAAP
jgi:crotonobetainyl-CoA:carnitine CoA-transferase CaiB-like acyl-CoA transferase